MSAAAAPGGVAGHPLLRDEIDLYFTAEQEDNLLKG